jgi:hypothetical protein
MRCRDGSPPPSRNVETFGERRALWKL